MTIGKPPVNMRFAVFIYDGVEPVDLATYGVLSMARRIAPEISMFTVAPRAGEVQMANGLRVIAGAEVPPVQIMRERHPLIDVTESASLVDCGRVVTGGGVTLGIDATLHLLARLIGEDVANETARIMEYSRAWQANRDAIPVVRR